VFSIFAKKTKISSLLTCNLLKLQPYYHLNGYECMNSVLRTHQARHRQVSQGMLDLKRVFWHCRPFTHGKRRGACPYQLLGLRLPTDDWWALLQMDPEVLAQKLSTQEVMR